MSQFFLPLLALLTWMALILLAIRRRALAWLGLTLALCILAPALHVGVFPADQIVHDRYLYFPLLGILMVVVPLLAGPLTWYGKDSAKAERVCLAICTVAAVVLTVMTIRYADAWKRNLDLWRVAVAHDPNSAFNLHQLGVYLHRTGELEQAQEAFEKSLAIERRWLTLLGRALLQIDRQRYQQAEQDLLEVLEKQDQSHLAYEALAVVHERRGNYPQALQVLQQGRVRIPFRKCAFSEKIAVIFYHMGDKQAALRELEAVRADVKQELGVDAQSVLFRLAMLYAELGRMPEAKQASREYLELTATAHDPLTRQRRKTARQLLGTQ